MQGVISIVFDANNSRVTLRSRPDLSVEAVGQAVRKTQTMKAFLVGKNDVGEEVMKSIGDSNAHDGKLLLLIVLQLKEIYFNRLCNLCYYSALVMGISWISH